MTPDEQELRRALSERIGRPSPDFVVRVSHALSTEKRVSHHLPVLALTVAMALTVSTIGVLLLSRQATRTVPSRGPASVPGAISTPSPHPCCWPYTAQLSAPSNDVVWALVNGESLYRSVDRGTTWERRPVLPSLDGLHPAEISFVNDMEGWLAIPTGTQCQQVRVILWRTTDAGTTWQMISSVDLSSGHCARGLSFVDATHGFFGSWDPDNPPVIYRTANGGRTWALSKPLQDPPPINASPSRFANRPLRAGWVRASGTTLLVSASGVTWISPEYAFRSNDGGATWTYVGTGPNLGNPIAFVTVSRWLQLARPSGGNGLPGEPMETTDGGASWHSYESDYLDTGGPEIIFSDSLVGYTSCPTDCADLKRTVDGGVHWTSLNFPGF
jgi:photosystem II stability/assembly factor-like uncharacterized protein